MADNIASLDSITDGIVSTDIGNSSNHEGSSTMTIVISCVLILAIIILIVLTVHYSNTTCPAQLPSPKCETCPAPVKCPEEKQCPACKICPKTEECPKQEACPKAEEYKPIGAIISAPPGKQLTQLWFSPLFANNAFGELIVSADNLALINKNISLGKSVTIIFSVTGSQPMMLNYVALDAKTQTLLASDVYSTIPHNNVPVANTQWTGTNLTYQFAGSQAVIVGIGKNNAFTIVV